jgi:hypothetical protein
LTIALAACGGRSLSTTHPDGGGAGKSSSGAAGDGSGAAGTTATGTSTGTGTGTGGATGTAGVSPQGAAGVTGAAGAVTGAAGAVTGAAGAVTGAAGTTSVGAAGVTGAAGFATGAAGVTGTAGTTGAGGTVAACGPCPDPNCKPGFMSVVEPNVSCCPICRPIDCATVDCANPDCPAGTHSEVPDGTCCPICVMGVSQACNMAMSSYQSNRAAFIDKYTMGTCKGDADCTIVLETNACVTNCGTAFPVWGATNFNSNITSLTVACNMACPPKPLLPCAHFSAVCSNGTCVALPGP